MKTNEEIAVRILDLEIELEKFRALKRELAHAGAGKWRLVGISVGHDGDVDVDVIERVIRGSLTAINNLK